MKIYTKTGDRGATGLFGGQRVSKDHTRVDAYGEIDELNSVLGLVLARRDARADEDVSELLRSIQAELFAIGANLATPTPAEGGRASSHLPPLAAEGAEELERWIDRTEAELAPLRNFILPGGSEEAALLHVARTVCRRAERRVVTLSGEATVDPAILVYLNRLSDLLFTLARLANRRAGVEDVPWRKEEGNA